MAKPHILIAGGGIGGLTTALALTLHGASVEIFEQSGTLGEIGAGLQLSPNAMKVLNALGLQEAIEAVSFEPEFGALRHFRTGRQLLHIPMRKYHERRYGAKYLHIHRADLHRILFDAVTAQATKIHLGTRVVKYGHSSRGVRVFTNTNDHGGDALIGADGINSAIRTHMFGPSAPDFTGQTAWRGTVKADKLPPKLIPPAANNWIGSRQHFVSYYIRGGAMVNFVAVREKSLWTDEGWSKHGNIDALRAAFHGWDKRVTELLKACDECFLWGLFDRRPLSTWTDEKVTLLGDAAHPMLPFMAQGAAMAIEDAWVVSQKLLTMDSTAKALASYENARLLRTAYIQSVSRSNAKIYHAGNPFTKTKRLALLAAGKRLASAQNAKFDPIYAEDVVRDHPMS